MQTLRKINKSLCVVFNFPPYVPCSHFTSLWGGYVFPILFPSNVILSLLLKVLQPCLAFHSWYCFCSCNFWLISLFFFWVQEIRTSAQCRHLLGNALPFEQCSQHFCCYFIFETVSPLPFLWLALTPSQVAGISVCTTTPSSFGWFS
jgi:hypothetical protein